MTERNPKFIHREEWPEPTVENIPDDVLDGAIRIAVAYGECTECGTRQFYNTVPDENTVHECVECDAELRIYG